MTSSEYQQQYGKSKGDKTVVVVESDPNEHYATLHEQRCSLLLNYLEVHGRLPPGCKVIHCSDFMATVEWHKDTIKLLLQAE